MPASDKIWRNMSTLHRTFAATALIMLAATLILFAKDHARPWKKYQRADRRVNLKMTAWRRLQFESEDAIRTRKLLQAQLREARAAAIPMEPLQEFIRILKADAERRGVDPPDTDELLEQVNAFHARRDELGADGNKDDGPFAAFRAALDRYSAAKIALDEARTAFEQARQAADEAAEAAAAKRLADAEKNFNQAKSALDQARQARDEALEELAELRAKIEAKLKKYIRQARFREDNALRRKQFTTADFDAARAAVGIAVRDGRPEAEIRRRQMKVEELKQLVAQHELEFQAAEATRRDLQTQFETINRRVEELEKQLKDNQADIDRINRQIKDERSTYFVNGFWPGKKWLELPILDAFNSPLKIDNLWAEDLEQPMGSFSKVRRFDRCTTCHKSIDKTMPGTADVPAYEPAESVDFVLRFDESEASSEEAAEGSPSNEELAAILGEEIVEGIPENERQLRRTVGLILADEGLLDARDVTVQFVQPRSPAARAQFDIVGNNVWKTTAAVLQSFPLQPHRDLRPAEIVALPDAFPLEGELRVVLRSNGGETVVVLPDGAEIDGSLVEMLGRAGFDIGMTVSLEGENLVFRSQEVGPDAFVALLAEGQSAAAFLESLSNATAFGVNLRTPEVVPGLKVGDVLLAIDGDPVKNRNWAVQRLMDAAKTGEPLQVTVRRGLPHPHATHPRLDLFLGSMSPHKKADFACTACHSGQGSATEFKWASHTPNSPEQEELWKREHGWFDNHHWIYPMFPKRFVESGCVKCHHDLIELEPSEQFPEPPAPKLMHGYHLVRKYGCYGCHEINGYKGPGQRQGPDLRTEPNFFAAAQQFKGAPRSGYEKLNEAERQLVEEVIHHPENDKARHDLLDVIAADAKLADTDARAADDQAGGEAGATPRFSPEVHSKIASLLKDVESPGALRRPGPALRYVKHKLSKEFLFDWIDNPRRFRPSTRMPRFFGNLAHLNEEQRHHGESLGEVEVAGIVNYLLQYSQAFDYLDPPSGITPVQSEEDRTRQIERGKVEFERCLACHTHEAFPDADAFRPDNDIVQGPDLSNLGDKFKSENARKWLYSWVKQPMRYHVRTVMPELFLDPVTHRDAEGKVTEVTDPAADIVAFLLSDTSDTYQPKPYGFDDGAMDELALENLKERFHWTVAETYLKSGIPDSMKASLKGAEIELVVSEEDRQAADFAARLKEKKLLYIGRKAISKYGCFGCHDVPGFEDAKPIGTGLADWGVKETSKLAFEHILQYVEHGHGHSQPHRATADHGSGEEGAADSGVLGPVEPLPEFFLDQLKAHNRIGFLYQKLTEPRSYDYHVAENKKYNEWLRMPQFSFSAEEREAVMTFVLGLVAEPPRKKYVYQPPPRRKAILEGKRLLEKYNCGGCHILEAERWELAYPPDGFEEQTLPPTYPFVYEPFSPEEIEQAGQVDRQGLMRSTVRVLPLLDTEGHAVVMDEEFEPVEPDYTYDPMRVAYAMQLYAPTILSGYPYYVSEAPLLVPSKYIDQRYGAWGGMVTKYLLPKVVARELEVNPQAKGSEAWAWLPPPLIGEGKKVQTDWLHDFLLDPHPIRPAVVFRMPRFNMSSEEASAIANYFAAVDGADFPYEFEDEQREKHLRAAEERYAAKLKELGEGQEASPDALQRRHLEDAMNIVVDKNYCRQCHIIADFNPVQSQRAKGPDLSHVQRRLRPEYVRRWLAKPTSILPYTAMPVNVPYNPDDPELLGTNVPQKLYHGNSIEQLNALVDLLMNFDVYTKRRAPVTPLVEANQQENPAGESTDGAESRSQVP